MMEVMGNKVSLSSVCAHPCLLSSALSSTDPAELESVVETVSGAALQVSFRASRQVHALVRATCLSVRGGSQCNEAQGVNANQHKIGQGKQAGCEPFHTSTHLNANNSLV